MHEMLRRFDRDTGWLATGVLGSVVLAAIVVAVQVREGQKGTIKLPIEATQVGIDRVPTKISPPFPQMGVAETATPHLALNSEISHQNVEANGNPSISSPQQAPSQAEGQKISICKVQAIKAT